MYQRLTPQAADDAHVHAKMPGRLRCLVVSVAACTVAMILAASIFKMPENNLRSKHPVPVSLSDAVQWAPWWKTKVMYQVYPRSFQDSNGDGMGDIQGIIQRLPYLEELGIGFIWLSPVMKSPMLDFGYDIEDFTDIDPIFGTLDDMKLLIHKANQRNIRILMDFVPNHVSNQSNWFTESRSSKTNAKRDWFVWHPGVIVDGKRQPPNNWASNFGGGLGSSWTLDPTTDEYYYHAFGEFQPDLNYRNQEVREALHETLRFWLKMGIAGFRIDAVPFLFEDAELRDEPVDEECTKKDPLWNCMKHQHTQLVPGAHEIVRAWRDVLEEFDDRAMFGEIYANISDVMAYYGTEEEPEFHIPFNFNIIGANYGLPNPLLNASAIRKCIRDYVAILPDWCHGNWVLGNHDNHRLMDRVKNNSESLTTVYNYMMMVPGTPVIYNGDEIAMRDNYIPYEKCKDPMCLKNLELFATTGRDPERTPMQWTSGPQAGFSTNPNTWLPLHPNHNITNVEVQLADPYSPLARIKRTLAFRNAHPEVALGKTQFLPYETELDPSYKDRVVAAQYSTELSFGSEFAVTVANWDPQESITVDLMKLVSHEVRNNPPAGWHIKFSTEEEPYDHQIKDVSKIVLPPGVVSIIVPQRFY